jgi:alpha-L-rhamnosidase
MIRSLSLSLQSGLTVSSRLSQRSFFRGTSAPLLALWAASFICMSLSNTASIAETGASTNSSRIGPVALQTDALTEPLGIDTPHPQLSWKLRDSREGARQTAYRVGVFSTRPPSLTEKPDVWDSGRVESSTSLGIAYAGSELQPSKRYYWRVTVWDQNGKAYAASELSWFETGLLQQANWHAEWIGHESAELHAVRTSGATWITNKATSPTVPHTTQNCFRLLVPITKPIERAILYTTGADTAAAWVNGDSVLAADPLPAWQQMPWGTYKRVDVTRKMKQGDNLLAIGITHYQTARAGAISAQTPMSAVLYLAYADGTVGMFTSAASGWKAQLDPPDGWQQPAYKDTRWAAAEPYRPTSDPFGSTDTGQPWPTGPVAIVRKTFSSQAKTVVSARLYATALGAYKFRLNGAPVGDQILSPGWMDFREHVPYQVYDVTAQIHHGPNAISAYLAPGWYSTPLRWFRQGNNYGTTQPALKAQLRIQYADGSVDWIATDSTWRATASRITFAEIYDGETDDARLDQAGWDTAAFRESSGASAWHPVTVVAAKEPRIVAQYFPPIREERTMTAVKITEPKPGVFIFDFGQNMSAIPRLQVNGKQGSEVTLRFAEVLNSDGTLYVDNLRTAKATDHFFLAGKGASEIFQPLFTFHGFRYAEITGLKSHPSLATLKAIVLHTDAPFTTKLATGDPMVNKLWQIVLWGQRSNFVGVPTDCPQRDERLGWSADAQVFWRTATYNMDLTTFSQKYAADLHGTQATTPMYGIYAPGLDTPNPGYGAAWSDAGVIIPWTGWIQSGNSLIIDQNWDGMEKYLAEIESNNPNHLWQKNFGAAFGDWLTPTITTPEDLLATAYWAYDVSLMQQMAVATHRTEAAERYSKLFDTIRTAFQQSYIHSDGQVATVDHFPSIPPPTIHPTADDQVGKPVETQTGYVLALYMHLMPDNLRAAAADKLVALIRANGMRLGTGFVGTPYLLEVLTNTGHSDVAYQLLLNRDYPSWGYLIDHGATTTWERWNGDTMRSDPSMNSYNHYAYGAVAEWIYRFAAGIDTDPADAGFHTVILHPTFNPRLGHLDFTYDSRFGPIHSSWTIAKGADTSSATKNSVVSSTLKPEVAHWTITLPANTSAVITTHRINADSFTLNGKPLADAKLQPGPNAGDFILPAGTYTFTATLQNSTSAPPSPETADAR